MGADSRKEESEVSLDINRPSHGRTWPACFCERPYRLQAKSSKQTISSLATLAMRYPLCS